LLAAFALRLAFPASAVGRHSHDYYTASASPMNHQLATRLPFLEAGCLKVRAAIDDSHVHM